MLLMRKRKRKKNLLKKREREEERYLSYLQKEAGAEPTIGRGIELDDGKDVPERDWSIKLLNAEEEIELAKRMGR